MRSIRALSAALLLCFCIVVPAIADDVPAPLVPMVNSGFKITKVFDAGHGLTGYVISKGQAAHIVYVTADRQTMLIGDLIDGRGNNLTQASLSTFTAHPEFEPIYQALGQTSFIEFGEHNNPKRVVYVIFDANCPYCAAAFQTLQNYKGSSVQLRWVPVAYLKPDSAARAAAILQADDPAAALTSNEVSFDVKEHAGGLKPSSSISDKTAAVLKANGVLMDKLASNATPTWVWKDDQGQIQIKEGLPEPMVMLQILGASRP